jgi:hypothetical protein
MKALDPSIRQAAQRVTAWHVARWRAHLAELAADTTPPQDGGDTLAPDGDTRGDAADATASGGPSQPSLAS